MQILNSSNRPITVANKIPSDYSGRLVNMTGTPSDGYSADIVGNDDFPNGKAVNYMDGRGWVVSLD